MQHEQIPPNYGLLNITTLPYPPFFHNNKPASRGVILLIVGYKIKNGLYYPLEGGNGNV